MPRRFDIRFIARKRDDNGDPYMWRWGSFEEGAELERELARAKECHGYATRREVIPARGGWGR